MCRPAKGSIGAHRESIGEKTDAGIIIVTSRRSVKRVACADSALRLTTDAGSWNSIKDARSRERPRADLFFAASH